MLAIVFAVVTLMCQGISAFAEEMDHVHKLTYVQAKAPACNENGHIGYYTCDCGKWFFDSAAQNEITDHSIVITAAKEHKLLPVVIENEVEATCAHDGSYEEVTTCSVCKSEVSRTKRTVPKLPHNYENGICTECGGKEIVIPDKPAFIDDDTAAWTWVAILCAVVVLLIVVSVCLVKHRKKK
ncbi:MAG: hypothetical protein K2K80_03440 [Clostridia bacterium]|nr:hypothetical protein [Clostridia bacterium]